jgi:aminoglycoside/choline kinase family phosphotransferase
VTGRVNSDTYGLLPLPPLNRAAQPFVEIHRRLEAEGTRPARVQAAGLAVGLAQVPHDLPLEADQAADLLRQFADRDFEARA